MRKDLIIYAILFSSLLFVTARGCGDTRKISRKVYTVNLAVDNIEYGGCGYFALYLHDYLDSIGVENKIIFLSYKRDVPKHIVVKVGRSYIDNNMFWAWPSMYLFSKGDITEHSREELVYLLENKKWNSRFNKADTSFMKYIFQN